MTAKDLGLFCIGPDALLRHKQIRYGNRIFVVRRVICAGVIISLLSGCSTIVAYSPKASGANQQIRYTQGVGTLSVKDSDQEVFIYPTFRTQEMTGPTFTIGYANNMEVPVNFSTDNVKAYFRGEPVQIYTYTEKIDEIQSNKRAKQVALAVLGAVAAGAAAYSASRQTYTNNYSGYVRSRGHVTTFAGSNTIRVYDPMAGIFVGAAIGGATGLGVQQLEYNAQNQEQAAGSILQENTVDPQRMVMGNLILKDCCDPFTRSNDIIRFEVAVNGKVNVFEFIRAHGAKIATANQAEVTGQTNNRSTYLEGSNRDQSPLASPIGKAFTTRFKTAGLYNDPNPDAVRLRVLNKESRGWVKEEKGNWLRVEIVSMGNPTEKLEGWVLKSQMSLISNPFGAQAF
jgi:hypothetical protein